MKTIAIKKYIFKVNDKLMVKIDIPGILISSNKN